MSETGAGRVIMLRKCSDVNWHVCLVFGIYEALPSFACFDE